MAQEKNNHTPWVNGLVRGLEEERLEDSFISQHLIREIETVYIKTYCSGSAYVIVGAV